MWVIILISLIVNKKTMNTKNLIIAVVVLAAVIGGIYYFSRMYYPTPSGNNNNNVPETGNAVNIQNFSFNPPTLTIKAGTTVTWTNNDSAVHDIKMAGFTSDTFSRGESYEYTFENPGTFDYICGIHPSMKGVIIVE